MNNKYLNNLLISTLLSTLLIVIINFIIDPIGIFNKINITNLNDDKYYIREHEGFFKAQLAINTRPSTIILGTSRAEFGINPVIFNKIFDHNVNAINLATSYQSYEESFLLAIAANRNGSLKEILFGLDYFVSGNQSFKPPGRGVENYAPEAKIAYLASLSTFNNSIKTIYKSSKNVPRCTEYDSFNISNGHRCFPTVKKSTAELFFENEQAYAYYIYKKNSLSSFDLEYYKRLLEYGYANHINIELFISPAHARQWVLLYHCGLWDDWQNWKKELVSINESVAYSYNAKPFNIWDFSGFNNITTETVPAQGSNELMKWYYESSHYKYITGDLIIDTIYNNTNYLDFGLKINNKNIISHLYFVNKGLLNWREINKVNDIELARICKK